MLSQFLIPYVALLSRAAWSIQQNLEGAGLLSSDMTAPSLAVAMPGAALVTGWDPGASVRVILGLLCLLCLLFAPFVMLAGYAVGRKVGVIATAVVLLLPGVAGVTGILRIAPAPEAFDIGGVGVTGDIGGILSLVALLVAVGWTVAVLAADNLPIRNKGWEVYDHIWLVLGLIAAVVFIADSQMARHDADFRETGQDVQRASGYLLKQVETYISWCRHNATDHAASCRWASHVHPSLLLLAFEDPRVFVKLGPDSSAALYGDDLYHAATPAEMDKVRREIADYNQKLCPVQDLGNGVKRLSAPSPQCQDTPAQFCTAFPDALGGKMPETLMGASVALASECVLPSLIRFRRMAIRLAGEAEYDHRNRNYRWMYFLGFSILLGGKLAGTTAKLASFNDRSVGDTRRVLRLFGRGVRLLHRAVCRGVAALGEFGLVAARLAWQIVRRGVAKRGSRSRSRLRSPRTEGQQQAPLDAAIRLHGEAGHVAQAALQPGGEALGGKDSAKQPGGATDNADAATDVG